MKKYLIKGLLALFGGAFLASCTDHDVEYVPIDQQKTQAYDQAFKEMIGGDVDPNQNWGFEGIAIPDDLGLDSEAAARAMTRGHNADANMWADYGWIIPPELTDRQKLRVKLYFQYNPWLTYQDPHLTNFFVQQVYKGGTTPIESQSKEVYPTGNGGSVTGSSQMDLLTVGTPTAGSEKHYYDHVNNFNYGRYSSENANDPNGTRRDNVQNSANVTYNYDNGNGTHRDHIMLMVNSKTDCVGYWSSNGSVGHNDRCALAGAQTIDQWAASAAAQNLGIDLGDAVYDSKWNRSFVGLDYDGVYGENIYAHEGYWDNGTFVSQGIKYAKLEDAMNGKEYAWDGKNVVKFSDLIAADPYFRDKEGHKVPYTISDRNMFIGTNMDFENKQNDLYIDVEGYGSVVNLKIIQDRIDAACLPKDGNLYEWTKNIGGRDHVYSDWIVTLTEANGGGGSSSTSKTEHWKYRWLVAQGRVFCEDLGQVKFADIDFNDIVFDARIWWTYEFYRDTKDGKARDYGWKNQKYEADICLLAAGGTITSQLAGDDVHGKFGVGLTTMVNTYDEHANNMATWDNMAATKDPVTFTYDINSTIERLIAEAQAEGKEHKITLNDIPIKVLWKNNDANLNTMQTVGVLQANLGQVPHKICLPIGTVWPSERRNISRAYTKFNDWATGNISSSTFFEFNDADVKGDSLYTGKTEGLPIKDAKDVAYYTATDPNNIYTSYLDYERMSVSEYEDIETLIWKPETGEVFDNTGRSLTIQANPITFSAGEKIRVYGTNADGERWITFHYPDTGGGWKAIVSGGLDFGTIGFVDIPITTADQATLLTNNGASQYIAAKNCTITKISRAISRAK